jgi:hypothetical protein
VNTFVFAARWRNSVVVTMIYVDIRALAEAQEERKLKDKKATIKVS